MCVCLCNGESVGRRVEFDGIKSDGIYVEHEQSQEKLRERELKRMK